MELGRKEGGRTGPVLGQFLCPLPVIFIIVFSIQLIINGSYLSPRLRDMATNNKTRDVLMMKSISQLVS